MSPEPLDAFSLKDMLLSVIAKLDRMDAKLDTKADEAVVQGIEQRLGMVERVQQASETRAAIIVPQIQEMRGDLKHLQDTGATHQAVDAYKRWLFGVTFATMVGVAVTLVQAAGWLH